MIKTVLENIFQDRDLSGNSEKWANWKSVLGLTTSYTVPGSMEK